MVTDKTSRSCWRVNNGFWWFLGRDACREDKHNEAPEGSERGQKGSWRASRSHQEDIKRAGHSFTPQLCRSFFATRVSRGEFTVRGKEGRLPRRCIEVFSAKIEFED